MPRAPLQILLWSSEHNMYELYRAGRLVQRFRTGDTHVWQHWLASQTRFAYRGPAGRLNVHHEARERGERYWYAYRSVGRRSLKRYLGSTVRVSFERLEQVAADLAAHHAACKQRDRADETIVPRSLFPAGKLTLPQLPGTLVARAYMQQQLHSSLQQRLTLLSAPAGWGKTTLLGAWAAAHPDRVAWVSLDALDNEPARFWATVIEALRTHIHDGGAAALRLLQAPSPAPPSAMVTALLNELAAVPGSAAIILVLDDLHTIHEPAILETLSLLIEQLPAHLRLVLASRVDPELPLARWRVSGWLAELRASDLRLSAAETRMLLTRVLGAPPADDELLLLHQRTEGWAAGVQLAALAMARGEDRAAVVREWSGSHRFLAGYVHSEILAPQAPILQRFLLRSAVLSQLSAELCRAVTGEQGSQELLEALERANMFVVSLDEQRRWYRFHELFREALLDRLRATEPDLVPRLHRRAARWYAEQQRPREAIAHALAAQDYATAGALVEQIAEQLWLGGEAHTVQGWIEVLPDAVLARHLRLALDAALSLLASRHLATRAVYSQAQAQVDRTLARTEAVLASDPARATDPLQEAETIVLRRRLELLRAFSTARGLLEDGENEQLAQLAADVEALGEDGTARWDLVTLAHLFWSTVLLQQAGAQLVPRLQEAKRHMLRQRDQLATVRVIVFLSLAQLRAGRLRHVQRECRHGLAIIERSGVRTHMAGYMHSHLAEALFRANRLAEAENALQKALAVARAWQHVDLLCFSLLLRVHTALAAGDTSLAEEALRDAKRLAGHEGFTSHVAWLTVAEVDFWLATGDMKAAERWAERQQFVPTHWEPVRSGVFLMQMRVLVVQQRWAEARQALDRFRPLLDRPGDIDAAIRFLAIDAVVLQHQGAGRQARAVAARLLALCAPEDFSRPLLELGAPMRVLLHSLLERPADEPDVPPTARAFASRLLDTLVHAPGNGRAAPAPDTDAVDGALTRREQEVLDLLADGASNKEIAAQLVISLATVKKHVSNVLGKLGVERRTQVSARMRARQR